MRKPKILIWEVLDIVAGGQKVALQIAEALQDQYECHFIIPKLGPLSEKLSEREVAFHVLDLGTLSSVNKGLRDILIFFRSFPKTLWKISRLMNDLKFDLIYANGARAFLASAILGQIYRKPVIWHVHNLFRDAKARYLICVVGKLSSVKKIVFVSQASARDFSTLVYKSQIIYNGVDLKSLSEPSDLKKTFGLPPATRLVSTISLIMPSKKQALFIHAIPKILDKSHDVHFLIIGGVKEGEKGYSDKLHFLVDEFGIGENISFLGHRNDIPALLEQININCVTSEEAFPLVVLESMQSNTPSVVPDIAGTEELVEKFGVGLTYSFESSDGLAESVNMLLRDDKAYNEIQGNCSRNANVLTTKSFDAKILKIVADEITVNNF